ncbi:MAG: phosphotransferase [Clostridia bacterium]|nr:phosphotransferase [Clostridia bacterium]
MAIDIGALVQEHYGIIAAKCISTREGWIIEEEGTGRSFLCRQSQLRGEKIIGTYIMLEHLESNGFDKTDKYITCLNGLPFIQGNSANFTLIFRKNGTECDISDSNDIASASVLLAQMHLAAEGFTADAAKDRLIKYHDMLSEDEDEQFNFSSYMKNDLGKTQSVFKKRFEELKRFRKTAKRSNNAFDYAYLEVADYYCSLAETISQALEDSPYQIITDEYSKRGCICHRDYTGHNILLNENESIINFESACIDLPIYDVANFIRRRMRKCGWSSKDAYYILENYSKVRPISDDELSVLKLLLQFPQKLWRIINKYYNSRRSWCEKSCLAKLEEVKQEREPLEEFAIQFLT